MTAVRNISHHHHSAGLFRIGSILYALAADGKEGVRDPVLQMTAELKRIMSLVNAPGPDSINREMLIEIR